jgi:hypothetical protein
MRRPAQASADVALRTRPLPLATTMNTFQKWLLAAEDFESLAATTETHANRDRPGGSAARSLSVRVSSNRLIRQWAAVERTNVGASRAGPAGIGPDWMPSMMAWLRPGGGYVNLMTLLTHGGRAYCTSPIILGCSQRSRQVVEQKHARPCWISPVAVTR